MFTFTSRRNLFGKLSGDSSSANLTLGDELMGDYEKRVSKKYSFLEDTKTKSTVADQQFYELPNNFAKLKDITVTIGTSVYTPTIISNRRQWDIINATTGRTSDIPQYAYIFNKKIGFYPIPASANTDAIAINYHIRYKELTVADYTTGTVTTATNGNTAIVGSGTSWTSAMARRYLYISEAQSGDGYWYEIDSVTDTTHLVLKKKYEGISISAGSSTFIIGQVSLLPEDYQSLPVYQALKIFFTSVKPDTKKASVYSIEVAGMKADMFADYGSSVLSPIIQEREARPLNPNNYVTAS